MKKNSGLKIFLKLLRTFLFLLGLLVKNSHVLYYLFDYGLLDSGVYPLEPRMALDLEGEADVQALGLPPESCHVNAGRCNDFGVIEKTQWKFEGVVAKLHCVVQDLLSVCRGHVLVAKLQDVFVG